MYARVAFPDGTTPSRADAIKALYGNVYLTRGYTHLLLAGSIESIVITVNVTV